MGIYSVNVLMPAESESACALARLWFEQKGAAILKMRQPNKVAQSGRAGGVTIVDKLDYRKFILRGESAAEAYLTKRTTWIDRVRHRDPSNGYAEAILWYPNAAKTTHKRPRAP